jgi:8-oxo-dGTP pyrophosphatase MutT (NUDIX family)
MRLQFAQKAVVIQDEKLLLVRKSSDDPHNPNRWELPGGRLKEDEPLDESLRREVIEETGLDTSPGAPIHVWDWTMEWDGEQVRVIAIARRCSAVSHSDHNRAMDDFIDDQRWFALKDVSDLNLIPSQVPVIERIVA